MIICVLARIKKKIIWLHTLFLLWSQQSMIIEFHTLKGSWNGIKEKKNFYYFFKILIVLLCPWFITRHKFFWKFLVQYSWRKVSFKNFTSCGDVPLQWHHKGIAAIKTQWKWYACSSPSCCWMVWRTRALSNNLVLHVPLEWLDTGSSFFNSILSMGVSYFSPCALFPSNSAKVLYP